MAILCGEPSAVGDGASPAASKHGLDWSRCPASDPTGDQPMFEEFKKFALRGNVMDLAIGVIIGAAFGRIVDSIVGDIFMPVVGAVTGGLDFSNYFTPLTGEVTAQSLAEAKRQGAVLAWGNFITIAINFLIIAWILFLIVKGMNRLRRQEDARVDAGTAPEIPADVKLLAEIRDLLAARQEGVPSTRQT
jgi:large conductance mechanosensitive channel